LITIPFFITDGLIKQRYIILIRGIFGEEKHLDEIEKAIEEKQFTNFHSVAKK
jgi:hypothetical protein